jgi:nitroreductase
METIKGISSAVLIDKLNWRYATKKFDPDKKLSQGQVEGLMEILRLAPSSMGLQPYTFVRVIDQEIRKQLRQVSSNQAQITDASEIIVFAANKSITTEDIQAFVQLSADSRGYPADAAGRRVLSIKRYVDGFTADGLLEWNARQAYIAMGQLLAAAAMSEIDACPMEGIDKEQYNRILGLNSLDLQTLAVVALGFRSREDESQYMPKVRKSIEQLFLTI